MYTKIYQNSYIVFAISFIAISAIFYLLEIGYTSKIENGKVVKKFSWKYPLAISLIIWIFWHFYLYPPKGDKFITSTDYGITTPNEKYYPAPNRLLAQRINMNNWN